MVLKAPTLICGGHTKGWLPSVNVLVVVPQLAPGSAGQRALTLNSSYFTLASAWGPESFLFLAAEGPERGRTGLACSRTLQTTQVSVPRARSITGPGLGWSLFKAGERPTIPEASTQSAPSSNGICNFSFLFLYFNVYFYNRDLIFHFLCDVYMRVAWS